MASRRVYNQQQAKYRRINKNTKSDLFKLLSSSTIAENVSAEVVEHGKSNVCNVHGELSYANSDYSGLQVLEEVQNEGSFPETNDFQVNTIPETISSTVDASVSFASFMEEVDPIEETSEKCLFNKDNSDSVLLKEDIKIDDFLIQWAKNNNICISALTALLKGLRNFHPSLPADARTLWKNSLNTSSILGHHNELHSIDIWGESADDVPMDESHGVVPMGEGSFLYFGVENTLTNILSRLKNPFADEKIELYFNIDGQSPFSNSKSQLWPILGYCPELHHDPFIIAAYYGYEKPPVHEYLQEFVTEMEGLLAHGFHFKESEIKVSIKGFICDAPAAAYVKCVVGHGGASGCSKCLVRGVKVDGCMTFNDISAQLRTDQSFLNKSDPSHHKDKTLLIKILRKLISKFGLDAMHLVYLGLVKRYLEALESGTWTKRQFEREAVLLGIKVSKAALKRRSVQLPVTAVRRIDVLIKLIKTSWPSEFHRRLRPLSSYRSWKAIECRQFFLYVAVVVLKENLSNMLYNHFLLVFVGIYILTSPAHYKEYGQLANECLRKFVRRAPTLLGDSFVSYNIHNLIHLQKETEYFKGCLDKFSAYIFEHYQGVLKRMIRGKHAVLQQLANRLRESNSFPLRERRNVYAEHPVGVRLVKCKKTEVNMLDTETKIYKSVFYKNFKISSKKGDNIVILDDKTVVVVVSLVQEGGIFFVHGRYFARTAELFTSPIKSSLLGIQVLSVCSKDLHQWPVSRVVNKCVLVPYRTYKHVCIPLLHNN